MKQFLHKKIPAALMALCLLLALCCQTLAAGRTLVPGGYTVGIKLYAEGGYCSQTLYDSDGEIQKLVDFIIDKKMIRIGNPLPLCRLYKELLSKDYFMTLLDLKEYICAKEKLLDSYEDRMEWAKKMLVNIANAGYFSSDRTIAQYEKEIWKLSEGR